MTEVKSNEKNAAPVPKAGVFIFKKLSQNSTFVSL